MGHPAVQVGNIKEENMNPEVRKYIDNKLYEFRKYKIRRRDVDGLKDYFARVREFGESCVDVDDFKTKFAASPLEAEYDEIASGLSPDLRYTFLDRFKQMREK